MAKFKYPNNYDDDFINTFKEVLDYLNEMGYTYKESLQKAQDILEEAQQTNDMNESVQQQINTLIAESGTSDAEVLQARFDAEGKEYPVLKGRLDEKEQNFSAQLAQNVKYTDTTFSNLSTRKKGKRPLVIFVADDATKDDLTILYPIARDLNVPIGIGVITDRVGTTGYMNYDEIREMEAVGCEIMSHSHTHSNMTTLTDSEMDEEIRTGLSLLRSNGFNPTSFIYPYNSYNDRTMKVVGRYFNYAFAKTYGDNRGRNFPTINNQAIDRVAMGSYFDSIDPEIHPDFPTDGSSLEYYKARVDECLDKENLLVFVLHSNETPPEQIPLIRETVNYIRSKGIDIVSPSEGLEIYANTIQIDGTTKFTLDANGKYIGQGLSMVEDKMNAFNSSSLPSEFSQHSITSFFVNNNGASGFPTNRAGIVTVYRVGDQYGYVKQIYTPYLDTGLWVRTGKNDNTWDDWVEISKEPYEVVSGYNHFSVNSKPSEFTPDKITTFAVNIEGSAGFPTSAGIITTYRLGAQYGFTKQEFRPYNNIGLWQRTASNDDTWGSWKRIYREVSFSGSPNQPISSFPFGETIQYFDSDSATEYNLPSAGVVKNVSPSDAYYAYQVLQSYRSPIEYYRFWHQPTGEWREWVEK